MSIPVLVVLVFVLLGIQGFVFRRFSLKKLTYRRSFSKRAVFAGETLELVEIIRNGKLLPLPWLRVESRLPRALVFGRTQSSGEEARSVSDALSVAYHRSVFFLGPYSQVTRRHTVTATRRGVFSAHSATLTCGDLFGASSGQQTLDTGAELIVWPRLLDPQKLLIPSSSLQGALGVRRWILPDPFLIGGIRPYREGDPLRDVHWPATARSGSLQVKTRDYTSDPQLLVILNVQIRSEQWQDLMEYEQDAVEFAVSYAATLCLTALKAGCAAGFAANAPLTEGGGGAFLPPCRSTGRDEELLDAFGRLRITKTGNLHSFLSALPAFTGLDIVLLSAYTNPEIDAALEDLRRRGNTVTVLWPREEDFR